MNTKSFEKHVYYFEDETLVTKATWYIMQTSSVLASFPFVFGEFWWPRVLSGCICEIVECDAKNKFVRNPSKTEVI